MAITGVILLVIGLVLPRVFLHNVELITVEIIEKKLEEFNRKLDAIPDPPPDADEFDKRFKKGFQIFGEYMEWIESMDELVPRLEMLVNQNIRISLYGTYCTIAGGILCLMGFVLWWYKLQRHQDKIIKAEAERVLNQSDPKQ